MVQDLKETMRDSYRLLDKMYQDRVVYKKKMLEAKEEVSRNKR